MTDKNKEISKINFTIVFLTIIGVTIISLFVFITTLILDYI